MRVTPTHGSNSSRLQKEGRGRTDTAGQACASGTGTDNYSPGNTFYNRSR
jgi:hypothetical protein